MAAARATRLARSQTAAPPDHDLGAVLPAPALDADLVRTAPLFAAALEREDRASLVFGGRRVDGPVALRDAFRHVADHAAFRVSELPGAIADSVRRQLAGAPRRRGPRGGVARLIPCSRSCASAG